MCRRGLKLNADKSKVIVLGVEEGLGCEIHGHGARLEQVSKLKYLECVLDVVEWEESCRCHQVCEGVALGTAVRLCYGENAKFRDAWTKGLRVYVGSRLVGSPRKRWIDSMNIGQAMRRV